MKNDRQKPGSKQYYRRCIFFILIIFPSLYILEARFHPRFDHLTINDGLSQSSVQSICQDSRGFVWMATQEGLNRYDGYSFKVFKNIPHDSTSLSDNFVTSVFEDSRKNLWVATVNGLNLFDRNTETFLRFFMKDSLGKRATIFKLVEDLEGNIWLAVARNGLIRFNPDKRKWKRFFHQKRADSKEDLRRMSALAVDKERGIWFGVINRGLYHFDPRTGKLLAFRNRLADQNSLPHNLINCILPDAKNRIWIGTNGGGLSCLDQQNKTFRHFKPREVDRRDTFHQYISTIIQDRSGTIWAGTHFGGVMKILSIDTGQMVRYGHDDLDECSIADNAILDIFEDRTGNLWFGTSLDGVSIFKHQKQQFSHFFLAREARELNMISGIYEMGDDSLWIGTIGGLIRFKGNENNHSQHKVYYHDPEDPLSISGHSVASIYRDSRHRLWFGTSRGLSRYREETDQFERFSHDPDDDRSISHNSVASIMEDVDKQIWIGSKFGGLDRYDENTGRFKRFPAAGRSGLGSIGIELVITDRSNPDLLWLGMHYGGINRFNRKTGTVTSFSHDPKNLNSISSDTVLTMTQSERDPDLLWIGTWGGGLNCYHQKSGTWKRYDEADGLCNNTIYGILEDKQGFLWISTIRGLSRMDPRTESFRNFYKTDGLQSNEFNIHSSHVGSSGRFYFGGINGMTSFMPDQIRENRLPPPVVITSFKKFNREFRLPVSVTEIDEITLSYRDNVFSFAFSALDFSNSEKNRYAYKLEGFHQKWIYCDARERVANFTNIPHGQYIFRVIGSNNDAVWNRSGASIRLIITPPFWKTIWFKLFISLLLLSGIFMLHRIRLKKLTAKLERQNAINDLCLTFSISKREKEVLGHILDGKTNNEIVDILGISMGTVKSHIHSIYTKTGVKKKNELYIKFSGLK